MRSLANLGFCAVPLTSILIRELVVGTCRQIMRHFVQSPPAKKPSLIPNSFKIIKPKIKLLRFQRLPCKNLNGKSGKI